MFLKLGYPENEYEDFNTCVSIVNKIITHKGFFFSVLSHFRKVIAPKKNTTKNVFIWSRKGVKECNLPIQFYIIKVQGLTG